jgi:trimeric autotransporter adhesin
MDAAQINLKKTSLLVAAAVLSLTGWSASAIAQPSITTCGSVSLTSQNFQAQCVVSSTGADIPFTASIGVTAGDPATWIHVNPSSGTATAAGTPLVISLGETAGLSATSHTATITLTPATGAPAGSTGGTITVTYTPGQGSTGTGAVAVSPNSLTFCPTSLCNNPQFVTLTSNSTSAVTFTVTAPSWISVQQTAGTGGSVSSTSSAQLSFSVNNFAAATNSSIAINYPGGSATVTVNVTSSGTGVLTASPNTVTLSYSTGGVQPSQPVTITDNSFAVWSAHAVSDQNWLLLLYSGTTGTDIFSQPFSGGQAGFTLLAGSNVLSLPNGTYNGSVTVTDSNGNQAVITVTLSVNGSSSSNGLTVNPGTITLPSVAVGSTSSVSNSATISSNTTGNLTFSSSGSCNGMSAAFSSTTIFSNSPVTFTVFGNPGGIAQSTYSCTFTINESNGSTNIATINVPVTWVVGSGSGNNTAGAAAIPTALTFATQPNNSTALTPQTVTITPTGTWSAQITYTSTQTGWIVPSQLAGSAPGTMTISINPTNLPVGTYAGTVTFNVFNGNTVIATQAVSVTLTIASGAVLFTNPGSSALTATSGSITSGATFFQVLASDGSRIPFTASTSTSWLTLTSPASDSTPTNATFTVNAGGLANGTYVGSINIASSTAANSSLSVPVVLTITGSSSGGPGGLSFGSSSLTFNAQVNGSLPNSQNLAVSAPSGVSYTVSANGSANGLTWLSISPSGTIGSQSQNIAVSVNQGSLPVGTYNGTIFFSTSAGVNQSVPVTLNVTTQGTATLTASSSSLTFNANQGGSAPASQSVNLTSASGSAAVSFNNPAITYSSGSGWLSASVSSNTTPATLTVSVNPAGLNAGTYTANIALPVFGGGSTLNIPVTLVVAGLPSITASPSSLSLNYSVGGVSPTATINVSGNGTGLNYLTTVSSNCNCIAVSPASGNTTANPAVTVSLTNATNLTAGSYTGTVTITGTNGSTGSASVPVTLTVTAPLPTIASIVNAASGVGGAIAPGEVVSIFGTTANPIGPSTPVALSGSLLDAAGNVPTLMAGVQVLFNGRPAPLLYVSATQINAVVPYGVAGFNNFPVFVKYLGQTSNGFNVTTTTTVPGIFTQNGAGTGPGAILNGDGSVNGPTHPAAKGSVVSVFMTGEGATSPAGTDAKVTCGVTGAGCTSLSQIPVPLLPLAVLVNGQPAGLSTAPGWVGYGEAPGLVSGVLQVTVVIPANAPSGNIPITISVGGNSSQQNVTVSVQ